MAKRTVRRTVLSVEALENRCVPAGYMHFDPTVTGESASAAAGKTFLIFTTSPHGQAAFPGFNGGVTVAAGDVMAQGNAAGPVAER